ncbi:uncharacterized protein LOC132754025 [Ruditapes philippinarum]|uniref:uncharacterized protein LOC132754025 n=1 Tax=Ruditapes philippinarum TaxID=129788 RepID=UPI00295AC5E9|nr:uncharacterized protein LOC132754025 [Ruditapes philippinarum]
MQALILMICLNCACVVILSGVTFAQHHQKGWKLIIYDWRTGGSAQAAAVTLNVEYISLIISYERVEFIQDPGREEYRVLFLAKDHYGQLQQCQADVLWQFIPRFERTVSKGTCRPYQGSNRGY